MDEYSKRDIAKILDLPVRTISYWTDLKIVVPDIQPSQGRGIARVYSELNLLQFAMIKILSKKFRVELGNIALIMTTLQTIEDTTPEIIKDRYPHSAAGFYIDPEWGDTKELLYILQGPFLGMRVLHKTRDGNFGNLSEVIVPYLKDEKIPVFTIIMIGQVKREALEITKLLKTKYGN